MFGETRVKDVITVDYKGELPPLVLEFIGETEQEPEILGRHPLVLSVKRDRDFVEQLLSVLRKADFSVDSVALRRGA